MVVQVTFLVKKGLKYGFLGSRTLLIEPVVPKEKAKLDPLPNCRKNEKIKKITKNQIYGLIMPASVVTKTMSLVILYLPIN